MEVKPFLLKYLHNSKNDISFAFLFVLCLCIHCGWSFSPKLNSYWLSKSIFRLYESWSWPLLTFLRICQLVSWDTVNCQYQILSQSSKWTSFQSWPQEIRVLTIFFNPNRAGLLDVAWERGGGLNQPAPSRSPQNTVKNKKIFWFSVSS